MEKLMFVVAAVILSAGASTRAAELPKTLVDAYLHVQTALVNDTTDGVAAQAKAIQAAAASLGSDAESIVADAKTLEAAKDIAAARTAFGEMSEALVAYAEKTKSDFGADVRVAYCPMVKKPWLQKEKEIKNPYYGKAMSTCGSFKK